MVFWKLKQLRLHVASHADYEYLCQTCGKGFRSAATLQSHQRTHANNGSSTIGGAGGTRNDGTSSANGRDGGGSDVCDANHPFACDICPKRFQTKPTLTAHKRIHVGSREFTCDTCGKGFVQKGNLDNHMLTHLPSKPYNCDVCDKS